MNGKAIAVGVGAVGLFGLLALLSGEAKASPAPPAPTPTPTDDLHSVEACDAYYAQREAAYSKRAAIKAQLVDIDAALMDAYSNNADQGTIVGLLAAKTGQQQALNAANAQISELDTLIAGCPSNSL